MIRTKLRATVKNRDHLPGTWETPINPDGHEAAEYIDNMVEHFGYIVRMALEHIDDEDVRQKIKNHAYKAIKGEPNESEPNTVLARSRRTMV